MRQAVHPRHLVFTLRRGTCSRWMTACCLSLAGILTSLTVAIASAERPDLAGSAANAIIPGRVSSGNEFLLDEEGLVRRHVQEGSPLEFMLPRKTGDGAVWSLASALPPGATFDVLTGTFRWTPLSGQTGSYAFLLGTGPRQEIRITVTAASNGVELWRGSELVSSFPTIHQATGAAQAGDTVYVPAGTWYETLQLSDRNGTANQRFTLEGAGRDHTIITGAWPHLLQTGQGNWVPSNEVLAGSYSTPYSTNPNQVIAVKPDGEMLWTYGSLDTFRSQHAGPGIFLDTTADRLYVRLEGEADANGVPLAISSADYVLYLDDTSYWTIRGIDFRHGGRSVIHIRDLGPGSSNNIVEDCGVEYGVTGVLVGWGTDLHSNIIRRCHFRNQYAPDWWWSDFKSVTPNMMEGTAVAFSGGSNNEVYGCDIEGWFNGISSGGEGAEADRGLLVHHNTIHNIFDDALEPESALPDSEWHNNLVYDSFVAFSAAPVRAGPVYVYRNVFIAGRQIPFDRDTQTYSDGTIYKLGGRDGSETLNVKVYFNTSYSVAHVVTGTWGGDTPPVGFEWYNNIFYGVDGYLVSQSGLASRGNVFNGNLYFSPTERNLFQYWNSTTVRGPYSSLASARSSIPGQESGWEGQGTEADPLFVKTTAQQPDLHLQPGSPAIDAGVPIPSNWPDTVGMRGRAMDMGAYEFAPAASFSDVPFDHPYYSDIEALYQGGYVAGCSNEPLAYCPEQSLNRAESAVFVERGIHAAEFIPPVPSSQVFADVSLESWAAAWITSLWADGYTAGCGTSPLSFCPWQGHTRAEACVFYLRMLYGSDYIPRGDSLHTFADVPSDAWYTRWVEVAYEVGLIEPCSTSPELRFCPNEPISRGLAAHMMVKAKTLRSP